MHASKGLEFETVIIAGVSDHVIPHRTNDIEEGALNKIEMAIRCYDPCLSCSTHALGKMPLALELISNNGQIINRFENH